MRNGYRHREFDTRAGTLDVAIPKLREGSYFPDWLLERRRRAERALTTVVATCYLLGVSTRRMEKLVEPWASPAVEVPGQRDGRRARRQVAEFRGRPLDQGPYTFVAADALVLKVREGGRVVNVHALVATGVNADGHREILGLQVTSAEDGAGWLGFFRDLTARGLTGVRLVTSDAHQGLVAAIGATLPGASWQRCRTHYAANLMAATPKSSWPWVRALLHSVYDQPDAVSVHAQFDRILDALAEKLPKVAEHLDTARADVLAFTAFPKEIWRQIWSNNPWVILSPQDDQACELLLCVVNSVAGVAVHDVRVGEETRGLGVSRCGRRACAARCSPRASASAARRRLLSVSRSRMRCMATSTRRSREASEARWRSGTARPVAGRGRSRRRVASARRSGWL